MKYDARKVRIIVLMISLAVAGLMAVQLRLLGIAWELKDQAFQRNVISALGVTAQNLETGEITEDALEVIYRIGVSDTLQSQIHRYEFRSSVHEGYAQRIVELDTTRINIEASVPTAAQAKWTNVSLDDTTAARQLTFVMSEGRSELIQRIVGDLVVRERRPIEERIGRRLVRQKE